MFFRQLCGLLMAGTSAFSSLLSGLYASPQDLTLASGGGPKRVVFRQSSLTPGGVMELADVMEQYRVSFKAMAKTAEQLPPSLHGSQWNSANDFFLTAAYLNAYNIPVDRFVTRAGSLPELRPAGGRLAVPLAFTAKPAGDRARVAIECMRHDIGDAELARLAGAIPYSLVGSRWTNPGELGLLAVRVKVYDISLGRLWDTALELGPLSVGGRPGTAGAVTLGFSGIGDRTLVALAMISARVHRETLTAAAETLPVRYPRTAPWSGAGEIGLAALRLLQRGQPPG